MPPDDAVGQEKDPLLVWATRHNHCEVVERLLQRGDSDVDARSEAKDERVTPLHLAARYYRLKIFVATRKDAYIISRNDCAHCVRQLLDHSADVEAVAFADDFHLATPVVFAAAGTSSPSSMDVFLSERVLSLGRHFERGFACECKELCFHVLREGQADCLRSDWISVP